jgi:hypothetical protein
MAPEIIFHIGLEKTGTDSFQRFCRENRRALLEQGVLYPVKIIGFAEQSHGPLVACYLPYRDLSVAAGRAREDVLRSLRAEIDRAKPASVLISAEHFSSRFRDAEVEHLARDFADYPCRVAVVLREHASRIYSAYAQWILAGRTLSFEDYCDEIFDPASRYVRYRETIAPWDRIFGRENMRPFLLAPGTNVIDMLCSTLLPQAAALRTDVPYWDNRSQRGASGIEALRQVNLALPSNEVRRGDLAGQVKWSLLHLARRRIRGLIEEAAGDRPQGRFQFNARNRARLREIVDADREWLEASYGIRLDAPGAEVEMPPEEALAKSLAEQVMARPWVRLLTAMR